MRSWLSHNCVWPPSCGLREQRYQGVANCDTLSETQRAAKHAVQPGRVLGRGLHPGDPRSFLHANISAMFDFQLARACAFRSVPAAS